MALGNIDNVRDYGDNIDMMERRTNSRGSARNDSASSAYTDILRDDYNRYVKDFRPFEERLLSKIDDTSLVDQAKIDAEKQAQISRDIQKRNLERYGGAGLSTVQRQEQERALQRGSALNLAGGLNQARIAQREINQSTLADLINIGQGVNRSALANLQTASSLQQQREAAYKQAKANYSSSLIGLAGDIIGSII